MILLVTLLPGKLTDYVLIGTLPSFALALAVSLLTYALLDRLPF